MRHLGNLLIAMAPTLLTTSTGLQAQHIAIVETPGPSTVISNAEAYFYCVVQTTEGVLEDVTNTSIWSIDPPTLGTFIEPGRLFVANLTQPAGGFVNVKTTGGLTASMPVTAIAKFPLYVDRNASGSGDGSSWENAIPVLQDALAVARVGHELRVASGIYRPDVGRNVQLGDRDASFVIPEGVIIRGGYAGTGSLDPDEWNPSRFHTFLCGDIRHQQVAEDNSYHVVKANGTSSATRVEAVIIQNGFANRNGNNNDLGGGLQAIESGLQVVGCTFRSNTAESWDQAQGPGGRGGGMYVENGFPVIRECKFEQNSSLRGGGLAAFGYDSLVKTTVVDCEFLSNDGWNSGALYITVNANVRQCHFAFNTAIEAGAASIEFWYGEVSDCTFVENDGYSSGGAVVAANCLIPFRRCLFYRNHSSSGRGGALSIKFGSAPQFIDCVFAENDAHVHGGAVHSSNSFAGGPYYGPFPAFFNCLMIGNRANERGGAVYAWMAISGTSRLYFFNCTIFGNTAGDLGGGFYILSTALKLHVSNSIAWENVDLNGSGQVSQINCLQTSLFVDNSCVQGWNGQLGGSGNFGLDPLFIDALGPDNLPATLDDDLRLMAKSPCIDSASNLHPSQPLDLDGNPRITDGNNDSTATIDRGAYELQPTPIAIPGDVNGDGVVNVADLLAVINAWGACPVPPTPCAADIAPQPHGDRVVSVLDLLMVINNWG
jgi:hypothetical protein